MRRPALVVVAATSLVGLTACGGEVVTAGDGGTEGFEAFTVSGDFGKMPQAEFSDRMLADDIETEVLVEGDGAELADGDFVEANVTIFNGFDGERTFTTYGEGGGGAQSVPVTADDPVFGSLAGETIGSRVAVIGSAEEFFGEDGVGGLQFGIGNSDAALYVIDLMREGEEPEEPEEPQEPVDVPDPLAAPEGASVQDRPAWLPEIVFEGGEPARFDFTDAPEPTGELRQAVLIRGEGPEVTEDQTVVIDYLGQVYGGDEPFDASYPREGDPQPFVVSGFVPGFTDAIVGSTVGSRVVVAIPPELGYGDQGNPDAGIEGTDTIYFVIDVLGAAGPAAE